MAARPPVTMGEPGGVIWCHPNSPAPSLRPGEVHLWRLETTAFAGAAPTAQLEQWHLSRSERDRALRYRTPNSSWAFGYARHCLRAILAKYLGLHPAAVPLQTGRWGKPELAPSPETPPDLQFNLAHGGEVILIAVALTPVGVDVEPLRPTPDLGELAIAILTQEERREWETADPADKLERFLRIWTRKEALLKGIGVGLSIDPRTVRVTDPNAPELAGKRMPGWSLLTADPDSQHVATLAILNGAARPRHVVADISLPRPSAL